MSSTKKRIESKSNGGKFQPGHKRFGGRQKGTKNKTTLNIREAMLTAGAELGGGGETGLKNFFIDVGKKKPELLGGWIADLVPRDPKSDENGNTAAPTSMTINVVGVEPGRFLSRAEAHASVWGEQLPLLEHDSAVVIEHDAPDPVGADDDEPPSAA